MSRVAKFHRKGLTQHEQEDRDNAVLRAERARADYRRLAPFWGVEGPNPTLDELRAAAAAKGDPDLLDLQLEASVFGITDTHPTQEQIWAASLEDARRRAAMLPYDAMHELAKVVSWASLDEVGFDTSEPVHRKVDAEVTPIHVAKKGART